MRTAYGRATSVRLSPLEIETAAQCARRLQYQRVWKAQLQSPAAADVFANCITESVLFYLKPPARRGEAHRIVEHFRTRWLEYSSHTRLRYASGRSARRYDQLGVALMYQLPHAWERTGLRVARDRTGEALINVPLRADLGTHGGINLELVGTIGLLAESPGGALKLLQIVCETGQETSALARRPGLLIGHQELVEQNRGGRGLGKLQEVGFWEFRVDPVAQIASPVLLPAPTPLDRRLYGERAWGLAQEIHRGSFPHSSRGVQRMPCVRCDYVGHCRRGDPSGLRFLSPPPSPPEAQRVSVST